METQNPLTSKYRKNIQKRILESNSNKPPMTQEQFIAQAKKLKMQNHETENNITERIQQIDGKENPTIILETVANIAREIHCPSPETKK